MLGLKHLSFEKRRGLGVEPDNLRSGGSNASRYEPDVNPTYHNLVEHCGVTVLAARARPPAQIRRISLLRRSMHWSKRGCLDCAVLDVFFSGELNITEA